MKLFKWLSRLSRYLPGGQNTKMPEWVDTEKLLLCSLLCRRIYEPVDSHRQDLYDDLNCNLKSFASRDYDTQYGVLTSGTDIFVIFRGTESVRDAATDILFRKKVIPFLPKALWKRGKPKCHRGVLRAYMSIQLEIRALVRDLSTKFFNENPEHIKLLGESKHKIDLGA